MSGWTPRYCWRGGPEQLAARDGRIAEAMRNGHIPFTRSIRFARVTYHEGCAMNKIVKFVVLPLSALIVIVVAIGAYIAATFDPNQYKGQIVQAVKDKTKRTLKLDGDIKLSLFPSIGAKLGKSSLSEYPSEKEF